MMNLFTISFCRGLKTKWIYTSQRMTSTNSNGHEEQSSSGSLSSSQLRSFFPNGFLTSPKEGLFTKSRAVSFLKDRLLMKDPEQLARENPLQFVNEFVERYHYACPFSNMSTFLCQKLEDTNFSTEFFKYRNEPGYKRFFSMDPYFQLIEKGFGSTCEINCYFAQYIMNAMQVGGVGTSDEWKENTAQDFKVQERACCRVIHNIVTYGNAYASHFTLLIKGLETPEDSYYVDSGLRAIAFLEAIPLHKQEGISTVGGFAHKIVKDEDSGEDGKYSHFVKFQLNYSRKNITPETADWIAFTKVNTEVVPPVFDYDSGLYDQQTMFSIEEANTLKYFEPEKVKTVLKFWDKTPLFSGFTPDRRFVRFSGKDYQLEEDGCLNLYTAKTVDELVTLIVQCFPQYPKELIQWFCHFCYNEEDTNCMPNSRM